MVLASSIAMLLEARWRHRDVSGAGTGIDTAAANAETTRPPDRRSNIRAPPLTDVSGWISEQRHSPARRCAAGLDAAGALRRGEMIGVARCGGRRVMLGPMAPWP